MYHIHQTLFGGYESSGVLTLINERNSLHAADCEQTGVRGQELGRHTRCRGGQRGLRVLRLQSLANRHWPRQLAM